MREPTIPTANGGDAGDGAASRVVHQECSAATGIRFHLHSGKPAHELGGRAPQPYRLGNTTRGNASFKKNSTTYRITFFAALALTIVALSGGSARNSLASHPKALFDDPDSPVAGNPTGGVTLIEFFDYHCGPCKSVFKDVMTVLDDEPDVRLIFKEYPILGRASLLAARFALAANAQDPGKYVAFHVALMASSGLLTEPRILRLARDVGLDPERLKAEMSAPDILQMIERNLALANALKLTGTPTFVIGDKIIPGAVNLKTLKRFIAEARAGSEGTHFSARATSVRRGRRRI